MAAGMGLRRVAVVVFVAMGEILLFAFDKLPASRDDATGHATDSTGNLAIADFGHWIVNDCL
jgi:hypothetical protein